MKTQKTYKREVALAILGGFGYVVFTNGHIVDGDAVTIYYGASDEVICAATFSIEAILDTLKID